MKQIVVKTWCDYPGCADLDDPAAEEKETFTTEIQVNVVSRGRPSKPITVELCEEHRDYLKNLFSRMQKYDQKDA